MWPSLFVCISLQCFMGLGGWKSLWLMEWNQYYKVRSGLPYFHQCEPCTLQPRPKKKKGVVTVQVTMNGLHLHQDSYTDTRKDILLLGTHSPTQSIILQKAEGCLDILGEENNSYQVRGKQDRKGIVSEKKSFANAIFYCIPWWDMISDPGNKVAENV